MEFGILGMVPLERTVNKTGPPPVSPSPYLTPPGIGFVVND